ncbi:MAG: hypothetical protein E7255_15740 [Lachnospiraceae bacterium]|nr:hypothetical protein [Lachnospiraceae bacterium]
MKKSKENENIFQKINKSRKMQIIVCVVLSAIVIIGFLVLNRIIDRNKFYEYSLTEDINIINSIEDISIDKDSITIDGYAFMLETDSSKASISLFLRDVINGEEIWLDVEQIARADVNSYFLSEYNYEQSGFHASLKEKLKEDVCYEVIINLDYTDNSSNKIRKTVSSHQFLLNGQLYDYNPIEFDKPDLDINSKLLREIFTDGKLCFYRKEAGMYVFQYDGKLYWIANDDFEFNENGQTHIIYHLYTPQINKLPLERIQYKFDNLDFYFEQYEYKDEVTAPYRVAIRDIPDDYAIAYVTTGNYDVETATDFWSESFHLDDLFN